MSPSSEARSHELVGRIGVPAVGKTPELAHVTKLGGEFDELIGRTLVSVFGSFSQVGQIGFPHDAQPFGGGFGTWHVARVVPIAICPGVGLVTRCPQCRLCLVDQVIDRSGYCIRSGHRDYEVGGVAEGPVFCSG